MKELHLGCGYFQIVFLRKGLLLDYFLSNHYHLPSGLVNAPTILLNLFQ
jgi:hypothetical protein